MKKSFLLAFVLSCSRESSTMMPKSASDMDIESPEHIISSEPLTLPAQFSGSKFEFYNDYVQAQYKANPPGLFDTFRECFPAFLALATDSSASPDDRGQAHLWCFQNFFAVVENRDNPLQELDSLVSALTTNWADAEWSNTLAETIGKNHRLADLTLAQPCFDWKELLHLLNANQRRHINEYLPSNMKALGCSKRL